MFKALSKEIKEVPELLNQKYFPTLDGLRAVAVAIVIIAHVDHRVYNSKWVSTFIPFGNLGVYIFFVLSGFLITTLLLKEKVTTGDISLKDFYRRRFFRIVPVAYLFLVTIIILKYAFNLPLTMPDIILGFFFLRRLDNPFNQFYTTHFWTLSYEEEYYILYPFILKKSLRLYVYTLLFIIAMQFLFLTPLYNYFHFPGKKLFYQVFVTSFEGLTIGSLFSILVFQKIIDPSKKRKYLTVINLLLVASIVFIHQLDIYFPVRVFSSALIALFIVFNINPNNKTIFYRILNSKPFIYVGKLSYSIYIWQQIFTIALPWKGLFPYSDSVVFNLLALFIVAYCSYNFYEKFFLRFRYKKGTNNRLNS